jgi:hypothetical protein
LSLGYIIWCPSVIIWQAWNALHGLSDSVFYVAASFSTVRTARIRLAAGAGSAYLGAEGVAGADG